MATQYCIVAHLGNVGKSDACMGSGLVLLARLRLQAAPE
jgi:hypothetical protein